MTTYQEFLTRKQRRVEPAGPPCEPEQVHEGLHDWQRELTAWAVRTGRAAGDGVALLPTPTRPYASHRSASTRTARCGVVRVGFGYAVYGMLGGFSSADGVDLTAWLLGDLKEFRLWHHRQLWAGRKPGAIQKNSDGSSDFHAYRIGDLPPEFVVARKTAQRSAA